MEISVLGATGTAGHATVEALAARGHTVRALSRTAPAAGALPRGVAHHAVDVTTGAGLAAALAGADAVVDCVNAVPKGAATVLVDGVRRALAAAADAGVAHWVSLSIVGIDRVPGRYYAIKLAQEAVVAEAMGVGTSIVRATQFPQLLEFVWTATRRTGAIGAPRGSLALVDPRDVAEVLADIVGAHADGVRGSGGPGPRVEVRGPQEQPIAEVARAWRRATGSRRPVVGVPPLNAYLRAVAAGGLVPGPDARRGSRTFDAWLRERHDPVSVAPDGGIAAIRRHAGPGTPGAP